MKIEDAKKKIICVPTIWTKIMKCKYMWCDERESQFSADLSFFSLLQNRRLSVCCTMFVVHRVWEVATLFPMYDVQGSLTKGDGECSQNLEVYRNMWQ